MSDRWKCDTCNRTDLSVCPLRNPDAYREAEKRVALAPRMPGSQPFVFRLDAMGVCPWAFITDFTRQVAKAKTWWANGQLGVSYLESPEWIHDAFTVYAYEYNNARTLARELEKEHK